MTQHLKAKRKHRDREERARKHHLVDAAVLEFVAELAKATSVTAAQSHLCEEHSIPAKTA